TRHVSGAVVVRHMHCGNRLGDSAYKTAPRRRVERACLQPDGEGPRRIRKLDTPAAGVGARRAARTRESASHLLVRGAVTEKHHIIPVWFFVGSLLFIYGFLIFVRGLLEWSRPPETVLADLHAPVWWGGLLVVLGALYCIIFRPGKRHLSGIAGCKRISDARHLRTTRPVARLLFCDRACMRRNQSSLEK